MIGQDLKQVISFSDRALGLLKKSNTGCLMFKTRFGIHTFFLDKSIDVLVLDNGFKVVKLTQSLKPNKLFFWNPRFCFVLELPLGTIKNTGTRVGDVLEVD